MGVTDFSEEYKDQVFYIWHSGGRKQGQDFVNLLPEHSDGRKPSRNTIILWIKDNGWEERADALDAEISVALDNLVIEKRKKMWEEQEKVAGELIKKGMDFLNLTEGGGIKTDASALRAIDLGLSTQRVSTGMTEMVGKIALMSPDQLTTQLQKLLGKGGEDALDAEIIEDEE